MPGILDSIDWGTSVASTSVTVYFVPAGESLLGVTSLGWTQYEKDRAMAALGEYALVSDLSFSETTDSGTATFKLITANAEDIGDPGTLGVMYAPGEENAGAGAFARDAASWDMDGSTGGLDEGALGYYTLIHEFGHGLGLAHPHDDGGDSVIMEGVTAPTGSYGDYGLNQGVFTVMSYNTGWADYRGGVPLTFYGLNGGLGALDIAIIQEKYGAVANNSGDNIYTLPAGNGAGTFYDTIYDTGGTDEIRNDSALDSTISLISATIDYSATGGGAISFADGILGGFTIAQDVVIENATGGSGDDTITGNSVTNILLGGEGNDVLDGGAGADGLAGGAGNDFYAVDDASDVVVEAAAAGTDRVYTTLAVYQLQANVEELIFSGLATTDFVGIGNELDNALQGGGGDDGLDGGAGADDMYGLAGDDSYAVDNVLDEVIEASGAGTDTVFTTLTVYTLGANVEMLEFFGNSTDDFTGTGNALANTISGLDGDDTLDGAGGVDIMIGDAGDDTYKVDHDDDITWEEESAGTDTVETALTAYFLNPHIERLVYTGSPTEDLWFIGNAQDNVLMGASGDDQLDGGVGADEMQGFAGNDSYAVDNSFDEVIEAAGAGFDSVFTTLAAHTLAANVEFLMYQGPETGDFAGTGNGLANVIWGGDGDDTLDGAGGPDELIGFLGDDSYYLDQVGETVIEQGSEGTDTVYVATSVYTLGANVENLTYNGVGGDFTGTGNGLVNVIRGLNGNDTLDGAGGADDLHGGAGNDTYKVDNALDQVNEDADAGTDTVETTLAAYALGLNVERLIYAGTPTADFEGTGNALANHLQGGEGDDSLDGGAGADEMAGLAGDDSYFVDHADDEVLEASSGGTDTVHVALTAYTLGLNVETLIFNGNAADDFAGTGNGLDNLIQGLDGDDTLDGGAGADTLKGGAGDDELDGGFGDDGMEGEGGNDTYLIDSAADTIVETLTTGSTADVAKSSVSYVLGAGVRVETLTTTSLAGTDPINLTGNEFTNAVTGNAGANLLKGMAANDSLTGDAGNDELDGGSGDDAMDGGAGNDTYLIDSAGDAIAETLTTGSTADVAKSSVSYVLGAGARVESLMTTSLAGTALINLTGNEFANAITGNAGANILKGMAGNDSLVGDAGNDELDGGTGDDTLNGGAGNDIYVLDSAADAIVETLTTGSTADVAKSSVSYILGAGVRVESLMTTAIAGTALIDLTGNEFANTITGNAGANILKGMAGNDSLNGDAGNDSLDGGTGDDTLNGGAGNDSYTLDSAADAIVETLTTGSTADVAKSAVSYILGAGVRVESLMTTALAGTALINLTGNEFDNAITGNAGANILKGMAGNDSLVGDAGNDTLDGGTGNDVMNGGAGNDSYIVNSSSDRIVETLTTGSTADVVKVTVTYALGAGVRVETLMTVSQNSGVPISLTGNEFANRIIGDIGANTLRGGAGDDTIIANSGHDTLDGGVGNDRLEGGTGNDAFILDSAADIIVETSNNASTADVAKSSVSYVLAAGVLVEQLMTTAITGTALINLTGNEIGNRITGNAGANILKGMAGNDIISGDAGNDTLDGGSGSDFLEGGAGNDTYRLDNAADVIAEALSTGGTADRAQSSVSYTLAAGVRVEQLMTTAITGTALINLTGNELVNAITGNAGANSLSGMAGNDNLNGDAGNDTLDGGTGGDRLDGGAGDDVYLIDSAADIIVETATTGSAADIARTKVSYVLAAGVRVETLTAFFTSGADPMDLTGNEFGNAVTGNEGPNILKGMGGNDTLRGGGANDDLQGGTGSDKIYGGVGRDTLRGDASAADHGVDRFYFDTVLASTDRIVDFNPADDFIHLARGIFTQAGAAGTLAADAFYTIGVGAADAQDRIIYDSATGMLFYDPDGTGNTGPTAFATVTAGLVLANTDFIVF